MKRLLCGSPGRVVFCLGLVLCFGTTPVIAQGINPEVQNHIDHGEFSSAVELAGQMPAPDADQTFALITRAQYDSGAVDAAFSSAARINDDVLRSNSLGGMRPGAVPGSGGVTQQDFDTLIDLIKSTVAPDDWDDNSGSGSIQAYPSGVYVDATGTLHRLRPGSKSLNRIRSELAVETSKWAVGGSDLRKISLVKLERACQLRLARNEPVSDEMRNLAGLHGIEYLIAFPESGDLVIAGPAGPWELDEEGRPVNSRTGRPVIQLDDLVVCLRNAYRDNGKFGCAITPRQENLAATKKLIEKSGLRGSAWKRELRDSLGMQDVEVFGIDPQTHAGRVLVEADYRMKLIGMGLEESIGEVPNFLSRVEARADGTLPPLDVVRWWFTLNYDDVQADDQRLAFRFTGTGVRVLSENEMLGDAGERIHTGTSAGPTKAFADDFTDHFDLLADRYPVYRQLKNVFDMALVAAIIRQERLAEKIEWRMTCFLADDGSAVAYQPILDAAPTQVVSVVNDRSFTQRVNGRTMRHTLIGVSGGIAFDVAEVIQPDCFTVDTTEELAAIRFDSLGPGEVEQWWWD